MGAGEFYDGDPCMGLWLGAGAEGFGEGEEVWNYEGALVEWPEGMEQWETWMQPVDPCDPPVVPKKLGAGMTDSWMNGTPVGQSPWKHGRASRAGLRVRS